MSKIRWIHFSDLHLNKVGTETKRLRKKLIEYLESMDGKFDYAFFTGDIRYAPNGDFSIDAGSKIENICNAINLPEKRLFMVAGNHDVDRDCREKNEIVEKLFDGKNKYKSEEGIISETEMESLCKAKESFYTFVETIDSKWIYKEMIIDAKKPHYLITTEHFNVLHIDSTLCYTKERQRHFIVGTYQIQELLEQADANKLTIIISHYSFDFIEENERRELIALFNDHNVAMWLAGHEHNHLARRQYDLFYEFQAGNLFLEEGAKTCFLIGEIDTDSGQGVIESHAWFSQGDWAVYPFLSLNGPDRAKYTFNCNRQISGRNLKNKKDSLRSTIHALLQANRKIFEVYGPNEKNMEDITSEKKELWEQIIKSDVIPNSIKIVDLLTEKYEMLTERDKELFQEYRVHVNGFIKNHEGNGYVFDAPRFPEDMYTILEEEID